jgi:penicillin-binding protein 1A
MDSSPEPLMPPGGELPPASLRSRKVFGQFVFLILLLLAVGVGALGGLIFVYSSDLPQVRQLEDYRPDVITELYADDGTPIGSFALERRVIVNYDQIPPALRDAVISIEDRHFESHWGVDVLRILRAAATDLIEWRKAQGASTLTQQLSRMLFLTPEKSFRRKFQEALLAIQIERHFTKPQIFTMYANQVSLGHGNFGFAAAAQFYFGKPLNQLTLPEAALLAGLPKTPTAYSPLLHPDPALARRNQVLAAMRETGKITEAQYRQARAAPLGLNIQRWNNNIAPYFVEDVRQYLEKKYGTETVQERGLRVYTTVNLRLQRAAEEALRKGLRVDDKRRGWRGPEMNILKNPPLLSDGQRATLATYTHEDWKKPLTAEALVHGLVMDVKPGYALVRFGAATARVTPADFAWTRKANATAVFAPGDVDLFLVKEIRGQTLRVTLDQEPDVQGALVAIENSTGAIKAMVGGYDFEKSKYNHARQAERQAGSSFKIYVYAQALLDGEKPFDKILDAPVSYSSSSGVWAPRNFDLKFEGNITLLRALAESRNVPAVRLLARVGVDKVIKLCRKFGITSRLTPNLPLALGASDLTLLEHTAAFTVFPNDGVLIAPHTISRVTTYDGRVIDDYSPDVRDVLPAPVARLMVSMLREVVNSGTAIKAKSLKRPLAGKTGTTNDFVDAWFLGFSPSLTCGVWVGFDDRRTLGPREEGAHVALPIWMDFMEAALKDKPVEDFANSPLLTRPEQVEQILASAEVPTGSERASVAGTTAPAGSPAANAVQPTAMAPPPAPPVAKAAVPAPGAAPAASVSPAPSSPPPAESPAAADTAPKSPPAPAPGSTAPTRPPAIAP